MKIMLEQLKFTRRLVKNEPFKSAIVRELDPGPEIVDDEDLRGEWLLILILDTNPENVADHIRKYLATTWRKVFQAPFHPKALTRNTADTIGSCSMLPRDKNGVVSPQLIVYGTKNLRVADLSVIPLHIASHTQCKFWSQMIIFEYRPIYPATAYVIGEKGNISVSTASNLLILLTAADLIREM